MKIVHIITRLILGGAQENTLITCRGLAQRGHEVTLITGPAVGPEGQLFEQTRGQGYNVIIVDRLCREISPLWDTISYRKLKKYLRRLQPDIVHTHSAKAGILGRYAADTLNPRPLIVHSLHGLSFHPYQSPWKNRLFMAIERAAAKRTDGFISVADAMSRKMLAADIGTGKPFVTAYSAIEMEDFLRVPSDEEVKGFRRKYGISEQATVLITVSRLAELKGHDYIIESARRLVPYFKDCIWLFVGDGHLTRQIRADIQLANLGYRFKFTGLLHPKQIPLAIHASDILVHCSLREGLARVLPQAMLCGKPVVSFDIDGAAEVVNENTGRIVEPENIDALTDACAELIQDPELCRILGENGRRAVVGPFAPDTMLDTIEQTYKDLMH
ncbi:MAG: glycosyltransferase family 4 protein [Phycisphaerae bacterium]|nr:glycosyltransferase family 4 protein [Phycisphaerae bacterium]